MKSSWDKGDSADSVMKETSTSMSELSSLYPTILPRVSHFKVPLVTLNPEKQPRCRFDIANKCLYPDAQIQVISLKCHLSGDKVSVTAQ